MDKDYIKGLKIGLGIFTIFGILFGIVYAIGFHSADEILGGTFSGNFTFQDNVKFQNKVNFTGAQVSGIDTSIPQGMIVSFNTSSCPLTWTNIKNISNLVGRNEGTNIGILTQSGGLAAAFDGDISETDATTAYYGSSDGWIGKSYSTPRTITRWVAYGNTDYGFHNPANGNVNNIWIQYSDDGSTWIDVPGGATGSFTDSTSYSTAPLDVRFTSVGSHNYWRLNTDTVGANRMAEIEFYEETIYCSKD